MTAKEYEHHDASAPEPVAYFDPQKREFYWARPTQIDAPTTVDVPPLPLYAALAAPRPEPEQKFDHSIGADRFKVVRGIFWWHIKIGDSPTEHGKFRSSAAAQKMADDLLREFRNGAFVQNALAAPDEDIEALRRDAELGRWIREETPPIEEIAARVDAMEDET